MNASGDAGGPAPPAGAPRHIALKVDAGTLRGTQVGVPRIAQALERRRAGATFLFSLGPDHGGRTLVALLRHALSRREPRPAHGGLRAMLYGTLMPGPDIGRRCAQTLRAVRDAGFETGVHAWDYSAWFRRASGAGAQWTAEHMRRAVERYQEIFGVPPRVHGAAGWRTSVHGLRLTQRLGFDFSSDTRGSCPYIPVIDAEIVACPQVPTTLPSVQEIFSRSRGDARAAVERLLQIAAETAAPAGHVLGLQAETDGFARLPVLEGLLDACSQAGVRLLSLGAYLEAAGARTLPRHRVAFDHAAGEPVAMQGAEFLPRACA